MLNPLSFTTFSITFENDRVLLVNDSRILIIDEFGEKFNFGRAEAGSQIGLDNLISSLADSESADLDWDDAFQLDEENAHA